MEQPAWLTGEPTGGTSRGKETGNHLEEPARGTTEKTNWLQAWGNKQEDQQPTSGKTSRPVLCPGHL